MLGASVYGADRLARVIDGELVIPSLIAPTTDQSGIGNSELPEDAGRMALAGITPLPEGPERGPDWSLTAYLWQAPNTFSGPLYFEDVMLERHGHERFPHHLQPLASAARFYATIPALPYLMTVRPPGECYYHMGYFNIGACAPPLLQRPLEAPSGDRRRDRRRHLGSLPLSRSSRGECAAATWPVMT